MGRAWQEGAIQCLLLQNSDHGIWGWGNWEGSETCVVVIQGLYILEHSTPISQRGGRYHGAALDFRGAYQ